MHLKFSNSYQRGIKIKTLKNKVLIWKVAQLLTNLTQKHQFIFNFKNSINIRLLSILPFIQSKATFFFSKSYSLHMNSSHFYPSLTLFDISPILWVSAPSISPLRYLFQFLPPSPSASSYSKVHLAATLKCYEHQQQ